MKGLAKPISSPGRTEKFPPPLMRFLRSNVGSKSRGRSRASPMFMRKKNSNNNTVIESTQEPSSPKVTCIGQVRVRRSSKSSSASAARSRSRTRRPETPPPAAKRACGCCFPGRLKKPKSCFPTNFRKWVLCFRFGYCKRVETVDSCSRVESTQRVQSRVSTSTECEVESTNSKINGFVAENTERFSVSSPPKNALLLTRCRSAPYRSSSLANRFWGSPLNSSENEEKLQECEKSEVLENPISPNFRNDDSESTKSHGSEEEMQSSNGEKSCREAQKLSTNGEVGEGYVHPLLLMRCKSEPAKTGQRLHPDLNFWKQRRFADEPNSQT